MRLRAEEKQELKRRELACASYEDFSQMSDAEVTDLLERARSCTASPDVAGVVETGGEE